MAVSFGEMLNKHSSCAQCLLISYINMTKRSMGCRVRQSGLESFFPNFPDFGIKKPLNLCLHFLTYKMRITALVS